MPDLERILHGNDLSFLRMVAEAWGIVLEASDVHAAIPVLVNSMCSHGVVDEVIGCLPAEAKNALSALLENGGRLTWAVFTRRFGEVRAMGAARRDRERPDQNPISPAEMLWYRALVGKAFFNSPPEPQEYAYLPDDLLEWLQPLQSTGEQPPGRAASPGEIVSEFPANDRILDHACTALAALRMKMELELAGSRKWDIPGVWLMSVMKSTSLLDERGMPRPEAAKKHLEAPRNEALRMLAWNWLHTQKVNDMRLLLPLVFEGEWGNDALLPRQTLKDTFAQLPFRVWWNISAFIQAVHERQPDFQRPAGDYESWFIRKPDSDEYLRGFTSWDEVDGALLRALITGPFHWLGLVDLAKPAADEAATAFRLSLWADDLLKNTAPTNMTGESQPIQVSADGELTVSRHTSRSIRYQVSRFCEWNDKSPKDYSYHVTPKSLQQAVRQGLKPAQLTAILRRHARQPLPPKILQAIDRWEKSGAQVRIGQISLLRVTSADIIEALRKTRAARFLGENIQPKVVIIQPGGQEEILRALADLGYLAEIDG